MTDAKHLVLLGDELPLSLPPSGTQVPSQGPGPARPLLSLTSPSITLGTKPAEPLAGSHKTRGLGGWVNREPDDGTEVWLGRQLWLPAVWLWASFVTF